jgi:FAD binding domain
MNTSVSDAFNLGWKIALAVKSISPARLLDSYTSERIPVIAEVLEKSTQLLVKAVDLNKLKDKDAAYRRGPDLFQLDVKYIGSPIVFDELDSESDKKERRVRAGCRAPNAPGIVPLTLGLKPGSSELFDIFNPTRHTVLIFAHSGEDITAYTSALREYPPGTMYPVVVMPKGYTGKDMAGCEPGTMIVSDSQEYCWTAYPALEGAKVVIIRPDGYIGAIARSVDGIGRYRALIFDANLHLPVGA